MIYTPKEEIIHRTEKLKALMERASLDGAFFHYKIDYFYLSGTMQDAFLYVPLNGEPKLFVRREMRRARRESPLSDLIPLRSLETVKAHIGNPRRVGFQLDVMPYNFVMRFQKLLGDVKLVDVSPLIIDLRKIKSPFEVGLMDKAAAIAGKVYEKIPEVLREGMTEIELGGILEAYAKTLGHEGLLRTRSLIFEAYTWHILSGKTGSIVSQMNSPLGGLGMSPAFPVGASRKKIRRGEPIMIDFGICYHGYQVDETRMFAIGHMPERFADAYEACREIHYRVLDKALEGVSCSELFQYSVELADRMGYGDYYLGYTPHKVNFLAHGIGIEISEPPFIAAKMDYPLLEGMTLAIEPKMVFPRQGACGIENTVLIEKDRYRVLTRMDEKIIVVD